MCSIDFIIRRVPEKIIRDIIFLVIINSRVLERFDVSNEFWKQFSIRKENTRKQLGLYEIEHIEDPRFVTVATNPKEYTEYFQSQNINKKHKGIRKSEDFMNLESFAKKIDLLREIEEYEDRSKINEMTVVQSRFTIKKNEMVWKLCTLQSIYDQMPQFRDLHTNKRCQNDIENINLMMSTRRYVLSALY